MPRLNTLVFAGLTMALSGAHLAPAQTSEVTKLTVWSGNGQVACVCLSVTLEVFQPIFVRATDQYDNVVPGATVTWTVTSGQMLLTSPTNTTGTSTLTSVTGKDGVATQTMSIGGFVNSASSAESFLVSIIKATSNNSSVFFTETQSLSLNGSSVIQAGAPTFGGTSLTDATITSGVGTTLQTPIQIVVGGGLLASNGVGNVSVRILNEQASPTLSCSQSSAGPSVTGGYADPGSVLSNSSGNANCYLTFTGSGTGTYWVLIGGVPGATSCATDTTPTPCYMEEYGPYSFTSVPGDPAAVNVISGSYQVGSIGQELNPLVAELVDAQGNAVQNKTMVWSVLPAGAAALANTSAVTDNNGQVSITVSLDGLATAAGAQIICALQSNTNISATFQETVTGTVKSFVIPSNDPSTESTVVGTNFPNPLVVQVNGASGPLANYPVQYLVSGPVSIVGGVTTVPTNAQGQASITVAAGTLAGTATVTAIAGTSSVTFNLTITTTSTGPVPNGIVTVSGNSQNTVVNNPFSNPLVVQVNSTAGALSGIVVNFSVTAGSASLSTAAATTNSSGQASVSVTAGATAGAVTVTATVSGGFTATFNLTVSPSGPNVSASSFLNAASRQVGALSPCSLAILAASGLTPDGAADLTSGPIFGRYPKTVNGLSVTFSGIPAPIVRVAQGATYPEVTLQVPCEVTPGNSVPVVVTVNGGGSTPVTVPIYTVSPGIFQQVMSDGVSRAVAVRSDGSFADIGGADSYDPNNPIRLNEDVLFYVTGLGVTNPSLLTDTIEDPNSYIYGVDAAVAGTVQAGFPSTGLILTVKSAHQAPGLIGVYEVQLFIPSTAPIGNNVPISIGVVPAGSSSSTPATYGPNSTIPVGQ